MGVAEPSQGLLVISCFDGIGALSVALDALDCPLAGYIAIETSSEASFPGCEKFGDINQADLLIWAAKYPNAKAVLIAGGPPCQGVSGLNASKLGADVDPRSSLYQVFCQLHRWAKENFTWCPVFFLMESVASMSLGTEPPTPREPACCPTRWIPKQ